MSLSAYSKTDTDLGCNQVVIQPSRKPIIIRTAVKKWNRLFN